MVPRRQFLKGAGLAILTPSLPVLAAGLPGPSRAATVADPAPLINADTAQQLIVHFLRNVSVEHIRDQWTKDFSHVVPDRPASLMQRVATLNSWLSDVRRDERLTFIRQPGEGLQVIVDGIAKGTIPGDDFSRTFMAIWLGSAPPSAELRRGLLGGKCD